MNKAAVSKVVLIDDSEIDLFIQKRFLEVYHFSDQLQMYTSAEEALAALRESGTTPPDAVFLDLNMPESDGFTFLKEFRSLPPEVLKKTKIVVLTSSENPFDRQSVLAHRSVVHFITKPIKHSDIEDLRILFQ